MLGQHGRGITRALFTGPARLLARIGVTPNMLTVAGTVATIAVAVLTLPQGRFILGPVLLALVLIGDSFDGILARLTGSASDFGAFLDSTMDRLADGAVFGSLAVWAALHLQPGTLRTWTVAVSVCVVVLAAAVPYARARAESVGAKAAVGIAERTDRLVIAAVGVLAVGLGAPPWVLTGALALIAAASLITVIQRIATVHEQLARAPQGVRR
ncbi:MULTISPECIES: phosphatidylinositol phosphate synthase [unclassified Actinomyces]|uniref:phosphatidylinositol phosphate synthase n=1 Tax=unclassified Actinomyces TaxID=2609248 RepID=UPI00137402D1|nr:MULTISPECIES: CDP-alcohol phosphatidyltransferase family protein [unclassified Actinomyces]MBW3068419.1 CDP-alcohol phosphatidyltransferase family protein [Actinomyces sp. 594]NDR54709.1 CDP-alcohol phosphatidyltransferase family protein [Actinomyces sp. 565]QHO90975.1 CDP-alcohol phosphatidyltransferase family protein [Actinomyces sp. 432]